MKFSAISLLVLGSSADSARRPRVKANASQDRISLFGYDEGDVYDFVEGWATGWFHRDMKGDWGSCLEALPDLFLSLATPSGGREGLGTLMHPIEALKALGEVSEIAALGNWAQHSVDEAESLPRELETCNRVYSDLHESSQHLSTSPSFFSLAGTFLSHPYQHTVEGFILLGKLYGSIYNHDLYDTGKSIAETMFLIFGNDELLDWMRRVKQIEKEEKIALQIKMAKEKMEHEKERQLWADSLDLSPEGKMKYELELEENNPEMKARRLENEAFEAAVHKRDQERAAQWAIEEKQKREEEAAKKAKGSAADLYWLPYRWQHEGELDREIDFDREPRYHYCRFRGDCTPPKSE